MSVQHTHHSETDLARMRARLTDLETKLEEMRRNAVQANTDLNAQFKQDLAAIEQKIMSLQSDIKDAGDDAVETSKDMSDRLQSAWTEIEEAFKNAHKKISK